MSSSPSSSSSCAPGTRRAYHENDDFFIEGNIQRFSKFVAKDEGTAAVEDMTMHLEDSDLLGLNCLECSHKGCGLSFRSIVEYSNHYKSHAAQCITCDMIFPNMRLMDIHILEHHSSYFAAQSEKTPSFVCMIDGCVAMFWNAGMRDEHMKIVHNMNQKYAGMFCNSRILHYHMCC